MNEGLLLIGAPILALGVLLYLRPMRPLLDDFASARAWREDPERAEAVHRRWARRSGGPLVAIGFVLVFWGLLAS